MESVTIFWSLVVLATIGVSSSDESALQFETYGIPESLGPRADISTEVNATSNDNNGDPENRIREELADKLIDNIKTSIRNGMLHDLVNEFHLDRQSYQLERKRRSPPTLLRALNLLPFRDLHDFYHTMNAVIFQNPGFISGIFNIAVILAGPLRRRRPGGGGSTPSRTGSSSKSTEFISFIGSDTDLTLRDMFRTMTDNLQTFVAESESKAIWNPLQNYTIDKAARESIVWIESNLNKTEAVETLLGVLDAIQAMKLSGMQPSKSTSTKQRAEGRAQSDKKTRKILKMLWERRPGLLNGGPTNNNSSKDATDVDGIAKVTPDIGTPNSNTRNVNTDLSTGTNSNNADNKTKLFAGEGNNGQKVLDMSDTADKELNIDDTIDSVLQSQNSDSMISNVRQYIPRFLKLLSENGFTILDLRNTVDLNDLSGGVSIESIGSILEDLKANEKFVNAMTTILDVSPEEFAGMGEIKLLRKLKDVLTS